MKTPLIRIDDLAVHFFTDDGVVKAVDGIDLTLSEGETLALVGESGCGKSVTALALIGLVPPPGRVVRGRIDFNGQDIVTLSEKQLRHIRGDDISMVFQEPMTSLNPVKKIGGHITEVIRLHQKKSKREAFRSGAEMLGKVGIPDAARRMQDYPHQMSGGMRQRVMIAMALACNPKLIIADEPTTALDVTIQAQILSLMNRLRKDFQTSILLITHDLGVVAETAHHVAVMYAGRLVERAPVHELFARPLHPYTLGLMKSIPKLDSPIPQDRLLEVIPGVVPNPLEVPAGCAFGDRCSFLSERCRVHVPPLVEVRPGHLVRCLKLD
jgi:peptide/nickel transport system ATP-binding protein/oligopeptide transport system ATP-binding protein